MNRINKTAVFFCCQFILGLGSVIPTITQSFYSLSASAQTVVETLPIPPSLNKSNEPQVVDEVFVPRDLDFRVPELPVAQTLDSYLVYIVNDNSSQIDRVKQLIPTAFIRQHQGKSVIQAGVFSKNLNALNLAQQLQSQGINARIFNLTTAKEVAFKIDNSKFYSVVVPTNVKN